MKLQGVVTTGIYCRATCTARPDPRNVRPMRNAVEAMASGFRPCLLCRPDRLPGLGLEQPASEVAYALRLIADGYLDRENTDTLAERIGYSTRQLARLFAKHVGASPDFVARARRAHLARRLIDETELSITRIAEAAGFSSIRQMNRVVRELFGFAPTELRGKRTRGEPLQPLDGGLRLRVPYRPPLPSGALIEYLGARAIPGVETVHEGVYRRTMNTCGFPGVVEVQGRARGNDLEATMHLATFGSILDQVDRIRSLFALDTDDTLGRAKLRRDRWLGPLVRRAPGLRLPGAWDRFETAVRIIVGQQVSVAGASTTLGKIVSRFGEPVAVPVGGGLSSLFPSPEALASADESAFGMPSARARTIRGFAAAVASGELDLAATRSLEATIEELCRLRGVGPWTAHLIAARVYGQNDAFPSSDLGLRRSAARLLGKSEPVSASALDELAEGWRPHRSLAAAYLWIAADLDVPVNPPRTKAPRV